MLGNLVGGIWWPNKALKLGTSLAKKGINEFLSLSVGSLYMTPETIDYSTENLPYGMQKQPLEENLSSSKDHFGDLIKWTNCN